MIEKGISTRGRVLYLTADKGIPVWGSVGGSTHIREFVLALNSAGYEVDIVTGRYQPGGDNAPSISVHPIPGSLEDNSDSAELRRLEREEGQLARNKDITALLGDLADKHDYSLLYERYSLFSFAARDFTRQRGIPYVLEVNSPLVEETLKHRKLALVDEVRAIEKRLFTEADHIVAVSTEVANYIHVIAPEAEVSVVPNGVNPDRFANATQGPADNADNKEGDTTTTDRFTIGFLGSLKPWHGLENLLTAFGELADESPAYQLLIIGEGRRLRPELEKRCQELNIAERVTFTGEASYESAPAYLSICDTLVAPYPKIDRFYFSPLKVFEYMLSGKAIVASAIGQVAETLQHEQTALLTAPGDISALAAALRRLKEDEQLRYILGTNAREMALNNHTWRHRMEALTGVFDQLCAKTSSKL